LNILRNLVVKEINDTLSKYNIKDLIPYLITRTDALSHIYEHNCTRIKRSFAHQVDYDRDKEYGILENNYHRMHYNYRYLIEKCIQLQPNGKEYLDNRQFQYLIAIIDWLRSIYQTSDMLHYEIYPITYIINNDFIIEIIVDPEFEHKQELFSKEEAATKIGSRDNPNDDVVSPRTIDKFLADLDSAFKASLHFGFLDMINTLQILTHWASYNNDIKEAPFYSAKAEEIKEVCQANINGFDAEGLTFILDFLTLKSNEVVSIQGKSEFCDDIPVWEYKKRYARYNIRPLLKLNDIFYWGPHSTRRAGIIWSGAPSEGFLPANLSIGSISKVIKDEKRFIENALENKTTDVLKRYTHFVEQRVELHKRDKAGRHPLSLGDYDVLAFYPTKNIVFNIECKDLPPPFCLKDAMTLRELIFGVPNKHRGYIDKVNNRKDYLEKNIALFFKALKWPIDTSKPPDVITIFLSRQNYWWTRFPPIETNIIFLKISRLSYFIDKLIA